MEALQLEKGRISALVGHRVYRHVYIMDLRGLDLSLLNGDVRAVLKLLVCASGEKYTETCWKIYCLVRARGLAAEGVSIACSGR